MLDMTSALYLGFQHPPGTLALWNRFTMGVPAAMMEAPMAASVATDLAALQGCEASVLAPSTLHVMWDLLRSLAQAGRPLLIDRGAYAISQWAVEYARVVGTTVRTVEHFHPELLAQSLQQLRGRSAAPVVVVDGYCPGCGQEAPLEAMANVAQRFGALIVCDDTQALGVLGETPSPAAPYGRGGGGVLCRLDAGQRHGIAIVASLAKGFGVPLAALSGDEQQVRAFVANSATRVHCSPPAIPTIMAAQSALALNRTNGDALRERLAGNVASFRQALRDAGVALQTPGLFPVQSTHTIDETDASRVHDRLRARGIFVVQQRSRCLGGVQLTFLISAHHARSSLVRAAREVASAMRLLSRGPVPVRRIS